MKARIAAWLTAAALAVGGVTYVSYNGIEQVQKHEGLRTTAYPDPATGGAPWTICWGHTKGVKPGMRVSVEQCEKWLAEDLWVAEQAVQRHVKVPLRQGQYDAYVSFVINVGEGNFRSSTMLRKLNQGDSVGSCNEFPRWKYANKLVLNGLVIRRDEERVLCLQDGPIVYDPKGENQCRTVSTLRGGVRS